MVYKDKRNAFHAVQVCWQLDDENRRREFDGLQSALRRFGLKSGTIVTFEQIDFAVAGASFQRNAGLFAIAREGCLSGLQRGS